MNENAPISAATARFIAEAQTRTYDDETIDYAKRCLVDWTGVAVGAHDQPLAEIMPHAGDVLGATGRSPIIMGGTASPASAALINGALSHALDFDDTHPDALGHISGPTWAATLALATDRNASEADALNAFITGFEVAGALFGPGMGPTLQRRGFHPTSVFGRFGAMAASSVLLKLDEHQAANAIGLIATMAGGLIASNGTMSKPFHAGIGAMNGILAAQLAAHGFEARTGLLDAPNGLAPTFVQDGEMAFPEDPAFTAGGQLRRNAFKPYACCKGTHPTLDATRVLFEKIKGRAIEAIDLKVNEMHQRIAGKRRPQTPLDAKFSTAYCAAIGLSGYQGMPGDFSKERIDDPRVTDLEKRVTVAADDDIGKHQVLVSVTLKDGERLTEKVEEARGNPDNPFTWDDLEGKFLALTKPVLEDRAEELLATLRAFEKPGQLKKFSGLVGPAPAARAAE
ncbi:MAG: MmgE/PrpD family protein [Rhodospirillales bacterium]